jgi:hypothetical protein
MYNAVSTYKSVLGQMYQLFIAYNSYGWDMVWGNTSKCQARLRKNMKTWVTTLYKSRGTVHITAEGYSYTHLDLFVKLLYTVLNFHGCKFVCVNLIEKNQQDATV